MIKRIVSFLNSTPRNRLIILQNVQEPDFVFTDLGYELSKAIRENANHKQISMFASEELEKIIQGNMKSHPIIGNYIAIKNLGILMEDALKINMIAFFNNHSQNNTLIVDWVGEIDQDSLCFLSKKDGKVIKLTGISHIINL